MIKDRKQRGFTLLESMVAIAVFTVGVSTAVFVITQAIGVGSRTRDRIIATHLAAEGIEVVRNIRDRNWLAGRPWADGITDLANACVSWDSDYNTSSGTYTIDTACAGGANIAYDGMYYEHTTAQSQFSRLITTTLVSPEQLRVVSTATCGSNCSISLEEYLYEWK